MTPALLEQAERAAGAGFDERYGGFGGAPKFPQPMNLEAMLRLWRRSGQESTLRMVRVTLEGMARGGMYDQLGGGFHRYSVDEKWLVPHFEKMLYDNAQLATVYLHAFQATGDGFFRRIATETLDYVLREMTSPEGGFYSAQDADSEGEEGKFFVWTPDEVVSLLGAEDARLFMRHLRRHPRGELRGAQHPAPGAPPGRGGPLARRPADAIWRRRSSAGSGRSSRPGKGGSSRAGTRRCSRPGTG